MSQPSGAFTSCLGFPAPPALLSPSLPLAKCSSSEREIFMGIVGCLPQSPLFYKPTYNFSDGMQNTKENWQIIQNTKYTTINPIKKQMLCWKFMLQGNFCWKYVTHFFILILNTFLALLHGQHLLYSSALCFPSRSDGWTGYHQTQPQQSTPPQPPPSPLPTPSSPPTSRHRFTQLSHWLWRDTGWSVIHTGQMIIYDLILGIYFDNSVASHTLTLTVIFLFLGKHCSALPQRLDL